MRQLKAKLLGTNGYQQVMTVTNASLCSMVTVPLLRLYWLSFANIVTISVSCCERGLDPLHSIKLNQLTAIHRAMPQLNANLNPH